MKEYLPSKQLISVAAPLLVGFFVSLGLLYYSYQETPAHGSVFSPPTQRNELLSLVTEALTRETFVDIDSDGDTLYDWEEALWGTDPHNPDTSGDGMIDGEAVRQGRDPLVPGPDNWLVNTRGVAVGGATSSPQGGEELTRSEQLGRNFIGAYFAMKERGDLSEADRTRMAHTLVASISVGYQPTKEYPTETFPVYPRAQEPEQLAYFRAMEALYARLGEPRQDDMLLFYQSLYEQNPLPLRTIERNRLFYADAVDTLLATPVPREALAAHVRLTNALAAYRDIIRDILAWERDAVTALLALKHIEESIAEIHGASRAMRAYFERVGYSPTTQTEMNTEANAEDEEGGE